MQGHRRAAARPLRTSTYTCLQYNRVQEKQRRVTQCQERAERENTCPVLYLTFTSIHPCSIHTLSGRANVHCLLSRHNKAYRGRQQQHAPTHSSSDYSCSSNGSELVRSNTPPAGGESAALDSSWVLNVWTLSPNTSPPQKNTITSTIFYVHMRMYRWDQWQQSV